MVIILLHNSFKLRLGPQKAVVGQLYLSCLPYQVAKKSALTLFADFYEYLVSCASECIQEAHPHLRETWETLCDEATFVLTHPIRWEFEEQAKMREAAVMTGLVPDIPQGRSTVLFVAKGDY